MPSDRRPSSASPLFAVVLLACGVFFGEPGQAQTSPDKGSEDKLAETIREVRQAQMDVDEVLDHLGVEAPGTCIEFREWKHLRVRQRRWLEAVRVLAETHPDELFGWLTGAERPPSDARKEALTQRNCLVDEIMRDFIEKGEPRVEIDVGSVDLDTPKKLRRWAKPYFEKRGRRRQIRNALTVSYYRSALSQGRIWRRKYLFYGDSFNRVSEEAAEKCRLKAGATWKPGNKRYETCWKEVLTGSDREREILAASSAPGLSRHHWATEFDFFSLSPRDFDDGRERHDEYEWMQKNALGFGFFQSYRQHTGTYMEERWHWSYYPISQALTEFASEHRDDVEEHLHGLWDDLRDRFNAGRAKSHAYFAHIRNNWSPFMFEVFVPNFEGRRRPRHVPFGNR